MTYQGEAAGSPCIAEVEALMDAVPAIVWIARDPECRVIVGNRAANEFLRLAPRRNASMSAPLGQAPANFRVYKDGRELAPHEMPVQMAARGIAVYDFEEEVVFDDGTRRTLLGNATPILGRDGHPIGAVAAFIDITAHRGAHEEIEREKRLFQSLTERLPHVVTRVGADGRYIYVNPALANNTGKPQEFYIGKTFDECGYPAEFARRLNETRENVFRTKLQQVIEFSYNTPAGLADFVYTAIPELDAEGRVVSMLTVAFNVSEQRRAARAMKESADLLRLAQKVASMGSYDYDLIVGKGSFSEQLGVIFGVDASRLDANAIYRYIPEEERGEVRRAFDTMIRTGEPYRMEHSVLRPDGTVRQVRSQGEVIGRDASGRPTRVIGTVIDITEQRRAEEELAKAQKLESLGIMAGGIAHDFNNLLTAIFGNVVLARLYARERPAGNEPVIEALDQAESAFKRARDLAQQLLTFSKGGAPLRRTVAIGRLLQDAVRFTLRGSSMGVKYRMDPDLWHAHIDEGQIGQVINNIVINALQAVPGNGMLTVDAHNCLLGEDNEFNLNPGRYVCVRFQDNGEGIPEENLTKIFDPYFTTKRGGSGLGLATTYSIIKRHDGHIAAASGEGATFTIYLPAAEDGSPADVEAGKKSALAGEGRALLMDDEDAVRRVGQALLQRLGYQVELAADGAQALRLFREACNRGERFAVVILDLTVPGGMGGRECVEHMRAIDPRVRALVSSGYSNDPVMSDYAAYGFSGIIPKPYQLSDLSEALSMLGPAESAG